MPAAAVVTEVIMEEEKRRRIRHPVLLAVIVTAVVTAALTAVLAAVAVNARLGGELSFAREHPKLRELSDVIDSRFVGEKDAEAVEEACAAAMVEGLGDPWSYYISAEDLKQYDITMANNYVGIGVTVRKPEEDDPLEVISVQEGGGARGVHPLEDADERVHVAVRHALDHEAARRGGPEVRPHADGDEEGGLALERNGVVGGECMRDRRRRNGRLPGGEDC